MKLHRKTLFLTISATSIASDKLLYFGKKLETASGKDLFVFLLAVPDIQNNDKTLKKPK
jgi:hypothetical protein